eukprot:TRINITY_DN2369_c0_g1_i1.p2 TRINITY_DN2369_c0_g1~~TRINITY_DN2369_c0_g1_i1.p2  ORF type:complete len:117 (-),score=13.55 TRINITY_DN2369_c0_g1_i1:194-544(-)
MLYAPSCLICIFYLYLLYYICVYFVSPLSSFFLALVFFFFLMIRRPPRSTLSSSSAASDVYKRQGINAEYGDQTKESARHLLTAQQPTPNTRRERVRERETNGRNKAWRIKAPHVV